MISDAGSGTSGIRFAGNLPSASRHRMRTQKGEPVSVQMWRGQDGSPADQNSPGLPGKTAFAEPDPATAWAVVRAMKACLVCWFVGIMREAHP